MITVADRMAVNAAIEKLLKDEDFNIEAAKIIINFARTLKKSLLISCISSHHKDDDSPITGCTENFGNVQYQDSDQEKFEYKETGYNWERVGFYKIRHTRCADIIEFKYFFKSDIITAPSEENISRYVLFYDSETLKPISLSVIEITKDIPFFIFPISFKSFIIILLKLEYKRVLKGGKKVGKILPYAKSILIEHRMW